MKRNTLVGEPSKAVMKEIWNRAPSVVPGPEPPDRHLDTGFGIGFVTCSFPEVQ